MNKMLNYIDVSGLNLLPFLEELLTYFTGFGIGAIIGIFIAIIIGLWLIMSAILKLALYIKKIPASFGRCVVTTLLNFVLTLIFGFIPLVGVIFGLVATIWSIKQRHTYDWWDAVIVWLFSILIPLVLLIVIFGALMGFGVLF